MSGVGTVIEDDASVTANLAAYLNQNPQIAKYFQVTLDSNGQPKVDEVAQTAKNRVIVQIKLGESK
jgi:riboflavin biosynthesis pyrimidine reductase